MVITLLNWRPTCSMTSTTSQSQRLAACWWFYLTVVCRQFPSITMDEQQTHPLHLLLYCDIGGNGFQTAKVGLNMAHFTDVAGCCQGISCH
ncbi:MAG: hypothetical protein GPOALKHO_000869 [Sodalis sp.]|nr:MAG: hypothetical protein GPOALKHO_000869 [Sodalis sp.]